jgi:hypothetical protein
MNKPFTYVTDATAGTVRGDCGCDSLLVRILLFRFPDTPATICRASFGSIEEGIGMAAKPVHVVPHAKGDRQWAVRREGATRASSLHATKEDAVRAATVTAKRERTELEVHTQDGKIAERNSYGHDPRDRKG